MRTEPEKECRFKEEEGMRGALKQPGKRRS